MGADDTGSRTVANDAGKAAGGVELRRGSMYSADTSRTEYWPYAALPGCEERSRPGAGGREDGLVSQSGRGGGGALAGAT
jgi:hypothetical protein